MREQSCCNVGSFREQKMDITGSKTILLNKQCSAIFAEQTKQVLIPFNTLPFGFCSCCVLIAVTIIVTFATHTHALALLTSPMQPQVGPALLWTWVKYKTFHSTFSNSGQVSFRTSGGRVSKSLQECVTFQTIADSALIVLYTLLRMRNTQNIYRYILLRIGFA